MLVIVGEGKGRWCYVVLNSEYIVMVFIDEVVGIVKEVWEIFFFGEMFVCLIGGICYVYGLD